MKMEITISCLVLLGYVLMYGFLTYKTKGKDALIESILLAEKQFSKGGMGAMKKQFVLQKIESLPPILKIFINEKTIDVIVERLQPVFRNHVSRAVKRRNAKELENKTGGENENK